MPNLFRGAAASAAGYRWFSPVLIATPVAAMPALALALITAVCLLLAAIVIEIPERVRATGVLLPAGGLLEVRAPRSGRVEMLSVSNGIAVSNGAILLWLTDTAHAPERPPERAQRLDSLQNELRLSDSVAARQVASSENRQRLNDRRIRLLERQLRAARAEFDARGAQEKLLDERARRVAKLAAGGVLATHRADEIGAVALQSRAASHAAWQRVLALQDELLALEQQAELDAESQRSLQLQAEISREAILREIAATELNSTTVVTAPDDGIAVALSVRTGSFVQAGQLMMMLHDPAERLEAHLYLSADNAAMIEVGQRVELQLRAYPQQLFGTQSAIVTSVSAAAVPAQALQVPIPVQGPVFEIRAALDSPRVRARGSDWKLPAGTVFAADLLRRRWPLYRWLMRAAARKQGHA